MLEMVNDYNRGGFARDGMYSAPLKYGRTAGQRSWHSTRAPVEGVPQLPAHWARLLLLKPVDATVTTVSPITTRKVYGVDVIHTRITLDKGSADGLYLGMEIWVKPLTVNAGTLTIDKLEEHAAECEFRSSTPPRVGDIIRMSEGIAESTGDE